MPIAATSQRVAAVVSPRTERPCRMIAPAPRKPMPLTICAAIRVGSMRAYAPPAAMKSRKPYAETRVKSAEPTQTTRWVRRPAPRSRSSRSMPIAPPSAAATNSRSTTCGQLSVGTAAAPRKLRKCNRDRLGLELADLGDAGLREGEQLAERPEVGDRAHRPPDQPLDLHRAPLLLAARCLAVDALAGRRRQERVLRRDPAAALVAQPARHLLLDHGGAEDLRPALRDERR